MSKHRRLGHWLLGLLVMLMLLAAWRVVQRRRPDHLWQQAEAARQAHDRNAAKIHLQNLLRRTPGHTGALVALAELELETAAEAGELATYTAQPKALHYLAEAARSNPRDLALQRQVLEQLLLARRIREASFVASRVLEQEPDNVHALFAATFHAIDTKQADEAQRLLGQLAAHADRPVHQTLALAAQLALDQHDDPSLQAVLERHLATAQQADRQALAGLSADERSALVQLLALSLDRAGSTAQAEQRALGAIAVLQTLPTETADPGTGARLPAPAVEIAHDLWAILQHKFPSGEGPSPARRQVEARLVAFRQSAIAAGAAGPKSMQYEAQRLLECGQGEASLKLIAQGLAQADAAQQTTSEMLRLRLIAAQYLVAQSRYREAEPHLAALIANKELCGWGYLLQGNRHLNQGQGEAALAQIRLAEQHLGRTLLVRAALADTCLVLERWAEALEQLKTLDVSIDELSPEEQRWYADHLGSGSRVVFDTFRAQLALGRWEPARETLKALAGTEREARAYVLAIGYLFEKDQPALALEWLAEGRRSFPDDLELLWVELLVRERSGDRASAETLIAEFMQSHRTHVPSQLIHARWLMEHGGAEQAAAQLAPLVGAVNVAPEEAEVISLLYAQALLQSGQSGEALKVVGPLQGQPRTAAAAGLLAAAAAASNAENRQQVEQVIDAAIQSALQPGSLQILQGELASRRGDYAEAIEALSPALDVSALRAEAQAALHRVIEQLVGSQGLDAAASKVESLLAANPEESMLLLLHADLEMRRGHFDRTLAALDRLEQSQKASPLAAYYKAAARLVRREYSMAASEIRRALKVDPRFVPALLLSARIQLELGDVPAALTQATSAARTDPRASEAFVVQAEALKRLGRGDEARAVLQRTIEAHPTLVAAHLALVQLVAQQEPAAALALCRAALEKLPREPALLADEVVLVAQVEGSARAQQCAQEKLRSAEGHALRLTLAEALQAAHFSAEALQLIAPILASADAPADDMLRGRLLAGKLCLVLGAAEHDRAMLEKSAAHFEAVLNMAPQHLVAANNLIWLLATELGKPAEAAQLAARIQALAPIEELPVELIDTLADAYRRSGQVSTTAALIDRALTSHPNEPRLHYQLGMLLYESQRSDEARHAFERALRLGLPDELASEVRRLIARIEADKLSQRE